MEPYIFGFINLQDSFLTNFTCNFNDFIFLQIPVFNIESRKWLLQQCHPDSPGGNKKLTFLFMSETDPTYFDI